MLRVSAVVELVWQDETGSTSATTLYAPSSLTVAEIDASATAVASILASLTDCVLVRQRIKYVNGRDDASVATGGSPITNTGMFFFDTEFNLPMGQTSVHSFKPSLLTTTGPGAGVLIDTSASAVTALIDAILAAGVCTPFSDGFVSLAAAYLQSRL